MKKRIIRIDKGDGTESEESWERLRQLIEANYNLKPTMVDVTKGIMENGHRIETPFAYYEMREEKVAAGRTK